MNKIYYTLILTLLPLSLLGDDVHDLNKEAQKKMVAKDYKKALELYEKAEKKSDDPILKYNAGRAAYRLGQYDDAKRYFEEALKTKDVHLEKKIRKNLGNTYVQKSKSLLQQPQKAIGELEKSVLAFDEALKLSQEEDEDLLANKKLSENLIEKLKKMIEKQKQDQKDQQSNQDQSNDQQDQEKSKNQPNEDKKSDDNKNQEEQKNKKQDQNQEQKQPDKNQADQNKNGQQDQKETKLAENAVLNEKQVEELLKKARQHHRQRQKMKEEKEKKKVRSVGGVEKDW